MRGVEVSCEKLTAKSEGVKKEKQAQTIFFGHELETPVPE